MATIPNWFEKGMVAPFDSFSLRADGDIQEDVDSQRHSFASTREHYTGRVSIRPASGNAHWRVHIGPIDLPFLLVGVDNECRYLLWGEDNRSLGWIYARTPRVDDATYASLLARFGQQGYDTTLFKRLVQSESDIGQPGFWSDGLRAAAPPRTSP